MQNKNIMIIGVILLVLGGAAWAVFSMTDSGQSNAPKTTVGSVDRKTAESVTTDKPTPTAIPSMVPSGSPTASIAPKVIDTMPIPNKSNTIDEDITNLQSELNNLDKTTYTDGDVNSINSGLGSNY